MKSYALCGLKMALHVADVAAAQGCPAGIPSAGNPACIPPDRPNSPYYQSHAAPQAPSGRWEKRWGAFVIDDVVGLGVSRDMSSKQSAMDTAMHDCIGKGGQACRIQLVYANQCGVIIEGDKDYGTARGPTVEEATQAGMKVCNKSDRTCQVYFSDCSHAALVR